MTVRYNDKLATIPGYSPGVPKGHSAEDVAASDLAQLASNESPYAPLPCRRATCSPTASPSPQAKSRATSAAAPA